MLEMYRTVYTTDDIRVRNFCVKHDLYTRGDNEEYDMMLRVAYATFRKSADFLFVIVQDIIDHSDPEKDLMRLIEAYDDETSCKLMLERMILERIVTIDWEDDL